MQIEVITMTMAGLALIFSTITVGFSFFSYAKVVGLENSTHQVQFVQADETEVDKELDTEHERYEEEML